MNGVAAFQQSWRTGDAPIKVVVIDDDQEDFFLTKELLNDVEKGRYEARWISNFATAVDEIKKQEADVYLIDFNLGEKTGLDVLKEVRSYEINQPMILLTGLSDREIDLAVMDEGATDFLEKNKLTAEVLERSIRYSMKGAADLLRLKQAEKSQIEKQAAEAANKAKSRFLAHMSHEIRTPLTAMLGFTELARDRNHSDEERSGFLEVIKRSGEHLLQVINDILDLSKVEDGNFETETTEFDLLELIKGVVELVEPAAIKKGLVVKSNIGLDVPRLIKSDSKLLRQILFNMLGNAVKFTPSGSVELTLKANPVEKRFTISIRDTGIGISAHEQTRLFQPFSQANASLNRKFGGTGLGLDLSKKLARVLGGDLVLASSASGTGSTFNLTLPSVSSVQMRKRAPKADQVSFAQNGSVSTRMRVLIAEDSTDNQLLIKYYLKGTEVDPTFANNGNEAVQKAQSETFDAILMDIQMPEMDGYEATARLRKWGFKKPIIALTAHTLKEERDKALNSGFTDFVSKPISRDHLLHALRSCRASLAPLIATTN